MDETTHHCRVSLCTTQHNITKYYIMLQSCTKYQPFAGHKRCTTLMMQLLLNNKLLRCGNDPSAGSPTETLLRLHLPLNDEV